jgi:uncharacterized protein (DUF488 family)
MANSTLGEGDEACPAAHGAPRTAHASEASRVTVYTIGHSNLPIEAFVAHLVSHAIEWLVDVRTYPGSQRFPHFNGDELARTLQEAGVRYRHDGWLGGKPDDPELQGPNGVPDYDRIEASAAYQAGIDALWALAGRARVAIMCGEGDYRLCHRERLIGRTLRLRGARVLHIQPDGSLTEEPQGTLLERRSDYPDGQAEPNGWPAGPLPNTACEAA